MASKNVGKSTTEEIVLLGEVIKYSLWRKKIRNINLRIGEGGAVTLSVPMRTTKAEIENFLQSKEAWIQKNRRIQLNKLPQMPLEYTKEECLERFIAISDMIWPIFEEILRGRKPQIKVRDMKTRWGVCNIKNHTITLNMRLAEKPKEAQEYVVLHEYVHFLHPNHQPPFHAEMAKLMPDYKLRRKLLRD